MPIYIELCLYNFTAIVALMYDGETWILNQNVFATLEVEQMHFLRYLLD